MAVLPWHPCLQVEKRPNSAATAHCLERCVGEASDADPAPHEKTRMSLDGKKLQKQKLREDTVAAEAAPPASCASIKRRGER